MSDVDDLDLINQNWTAPESELRRQVAKILRKLHPLETDYGTIINDMLCKYVSYIDSKQRIAKINRIVEVVDMPITQQEKTELLIRREIDDKKLNRKFYYSQMEPPDFVSLDAFGPEFLRIFHLFFLNSFCRRNWRNDDEKQLLRSTQNATMIECFVMITSSGRLMIVLLANLGGD